MKDPFEKEKKFTKAYIEENRLFGLIEKQNWFITGLLTGFTTALLGAIVDEVDKLGYTGFAIGAITDYFMRKNYHTELDKFKSGRSRYNGILMDGGDEDE